MRALWVGLAGFAGVYAVLATVVLVFDDHRYHTVMFAPVVTGDWRFPPATPPCSATHGKPTCVTVSYTYPDCTKFNPVQCWIYPTSGRAPDTLEYRDSDMTIQVGGFDLGLPGHEKDTERHNFQNMRVSASPPGTVAIGLTIEVPSGTPQVDTKRIVLTGPCGNGPHNKDGSYPVTVSPFLTFSFEDAIQRLVTSPPRRFQANLFFAANRATLRECTLRLGDAVHTLSGRKVPDVRFTAVPIAHYDPTSPD